MFLSTLKKLNVLYNAVHLEAMLPYVGIKSEGIKTERISVTKTPVFVQAIVDFTREIIRLDYSHIIKRGGKDG